MKRLAEILAWIFAGVLAVCVSRILWALVEIAVARMR